MTLPYMRPALAERESAPSRLEWVIAVFAVIVQQGAFISLPLVIGGSSLRAVVNPVNTFAVSISLASISLVLIPRARKIALLGLCNLPSLLFVLVVLISTRWSLHPDITLRRGIGYVLTILLAAYLAVRFDEGDRLKVLSSSFVISALGSLAFVAMFPQYGIMNGADLSGAWRGVFTHKNVLGPIMAAGLFVELYILVRDSGRQRWRFATLAMFAALIALSHSTTAWLLAALYLLGTGIYLLWRWQRTIALAAIANCVLAILAGAMLLWRNPVQLLTAIGKDPTLTGRTTLWDIVLELIRERPLLGWGYHSMWVVGDATTVFADKLTGQWGVTGSHNAYLEIALQLGLVGLGVMLVILATALWRGIRCCQSGIAPLGWFSILFIVGSILSAATVEILGQNQVVEWLVFNVLMFSCGIELLGVERSRFANAVPVSLHVPRRQLRQTSSVMEA